MRGETKFKELEDRDSKTKFKSWGLVFSKFAAFVKYGAEERVDSSDDLSVRG